MATSAAKALAPVAQTILDTLALEIMNLVYGPGGTPPPSSQDVSYIDTTSQQRANNQFDNSFGYIYNGNQSTPTNPNLGTEWTPIGQSDMLAWDPGASKPVDIQTYLQTIFESTQLSPNDISAMVTELTALFKDLWSMFNSTWTDYNKTFVFAPTAKRTYSIYVDLQMATSGYTNSSGSNVGLAAFCFVAYPVDTPSPSL